MLGNPSPISPLLAKDFVAIPEPSDLFLIEPRILPKRGRMCLLGLSGVGKSFLQIEAIRNIINGDPLYGIPSITTRPCTTLYIEKELGAGLGLRIKTSFEGLDDAAWSRCKIWSQPKHFYLSTPQCIEMLAKYCREEGIELLVLDPLNRLHMFEQNDNSQMLRIVEAFEYIQESGTAVLYSHHMRKPPEGHFRKDHDPLDHYNSNGAARIIDDNDAIITIARRPGRLVPEWESWALDARFSKIRHGQSLPADIVLHVNEANNFRTLYAPGSIKFSESRKKPFVVPQAMPFSLMQGGTGQL